MASVPGDPLSLCAGLSVFEHCQRSTGASVSVGRQDLISPTQCPAQSKGVLLLSSAILANNGITVLQGRCLPIGWGTQAHWAHASLVSLPHLTAIYWTCRVFFPLLAMLRFSTPGSCCCFLSQWGLSSAVSLPQTSGLWKSFWATVVGHIIKWSKAFLPGNHVPV